MILRATPNVIVGVDSYVINNLATNTYGNREALALTAMHATFDLLTADIELLRRKD